MEATESLTPNEGPRINDLMERLGDHEIFRDGHDWVEAADVWKRPLRPQVFKYQSFEATTTSTVLSYDSLTMNRTLTALYEQDFLYLPSTSEKNLLSMLRAAYNRELRALAAAVTPELEERVFRNIRKELVVGGVWTAEAFKNYFYSKLDTAQTQSGPSSINLVMSSEDRPLMAKLLLIQHAVDFLPESSHMARFVKGDYGEAQSAMFRVLIDEFGYGKHEVKHSSLFKETLKSVGMLDNSHAYWNYYLTSTLLNNNYFHYLTKSPERFFEYVGAITYAENAFGPYCNKVGRLLKSCFAEVDARYYIEHYHIDGYHGSMTLNEILIPLAERFGPSVYTEFVKGVEMSCLLGTIMEEDLCAQIVWMEKKNQYRQLAEDIRDSVLADIDNLTVMLLDEPKGELSVPHVHDGDEFCIVDEGLLRFCHGPNCFSDLGPGDCVVIAKNRMHGALVLSDRCRYRILSIKDYQNYADYSL
ncbi:iron-containing redox enzyme family protein [Pseudomonas oryzihabitans]|uniref:iron-containing redox enzyme family protein n=1 Tax=Pseudomonas oryzihabitans TaxID=47885 RepID=UPI0020D08ACD|nr:iron-containing redox enzyme family protein [Pseudomonas oryzihabitans]